MPRTNRRTIRKNGGCFVLVFSAAAVCAATNLGVFVPAAEIEWDGGPDGKGNVLTDPVNWAGDVLPGEGDDAVLPNGTAPPSSVYLSSDWRVGSLTTRGSFFNLGTTGASGKLILTGGANELLLAVDGKVRDPWLPGSFIIGSTPGLELVHTGDIFVSGSSEALRIYSVIGESGGPQGFTKTGSGALVLAGANTYSGATVVTAGRLALSGSGNLGSLAGGTNVQPGGTLDLSSGSVSAEPLTLSGAGFQGAGALIVPTLFNGPITLAGDSTIATGVRTPGVVATRRRLTGTIGDAGGSAALRKIGPDTLLLEAATTYSGATIIDDGSIELGTAAASMASSSELRIRSGSELYLNNQFIANANRIGGNVVLESGKLRLLNQAGDGLIEAYGILDLHPGLNIVQLENSRSTTFVGESLQRETGGTVVFAGSKLGAVEAVVGSSRILFTSPPTDLLVGGGGPSGTSSISILPFAWGQVGTYSPSQSGGFVTYDTNGIRILDVNTEYTALTSAGAGQNARSTGGALAETRTVNSLLLSGGTLSGTGTLSIGSGALAGSGTIGIHELGFGAADGVVAFNGAINSAITGSGDLIAKPGAGGTLTLGGVNTFGGAGKNVFVNDGTLSVSSNANLGDPANAVVINNGATLSLGSFALDHPVVLPGGIAYLKGSGSAEIGSTISGSGTLDVRLPSLKLAGVNTYTGGTILWNGTTLVLASDQALGTGPVTFSNDSPNQTPVILRSEGGPRTISSPVNLHGSVTLQGADPWTFVGPVTQAGFLTILDPASEARFEQSITGTLYKNGSGELVLDADNPWLNLTLDYGPVSVAGNLNRLTVEGAGELRLATAHPVSVNQLYVSAFNPSSKNFIISGDGDLTIPTFSSTLALTDAITLENRGITRFTDTFSGHIRKTGPGELEFSTRDGKSIQTWPS